VEHGGATKFLYGYRCESSRSNWIGVICCMMQINLAFGKFEKRFIIFALWFATVPLIPLLRQSGNGPELGEGDVWIRNIWYGIYVVVLFWAFVRKNRIIYVMIQDPLLLFLIGLTLLSVLWSTSPTITLRRSVALVCTTLLGVYLATRFKLKEQLHLLAWAFIIAAVLSIVFVLTLPKYGIENDGSWRGIYQQKNDLGRYMVFGAVVFFLLARSTSQYCWRFWMGFGLCVVLFMFSDSRTALLGFFMVIGFSPLYKILRRKWHYLLNVPFFIAFLLFGVGAGILIYISRAPLLALVGKSDTISGRTILWSILSDMIEQKPWLGYGYSGFWLENHGKTIEVWQRLTFWQPRHAHNGFLEIVLNLGLFGLVVFVVHFLTTLIRAVRWLRLHKTPIDIWPIACLIFTFSAGLTGSVFLERNNLFWILYVTTSFTLLIQRERVQK
jgi:exopolysaccharide production protein ExoQ